ncbi:uncharacterized protein LOC143913709 [Arctopsyche grandis]|uniref:uncharacterized protein LOC143913709 n=1 Tax=Arctopsyche grandis TaxID=121162 RepID=UPI00406D7B96
MSGYPLKIHHRLVKVEIYVKSVVVPKEVPFKERSRYKSLSPESDPKIPYRRVRYRNRSFCGSVISYVKNPNPLHFHLPSHRLSNSSSLNSNLDRTIDDDYVFDCIDKAFCLNASEKNASIASEFIILNEQIKLQLRKMKNFLADLELKFTPSVNNLVRC